MAERTAALAAGALAATTRRTYSTGTRAYHAFCTERGQDPWPTSAATLAMFAASLSSTLTHSTIRSYLAGIRAEAVELGSPLDPHSAPLLARVLKGIQREKGALPAQKPFLPFTSAIIRRLAPHLNPLDYDDALLLAAWWLGSSCLLRMGEFAPNQTTPPDRILLIRNVECASAEAKRPSYTLRLNSSKTDQLGAGAQVAISAECFDAVTHHLAIRNVSLDDSDLPLLASRTGGAMSRGWLLPRTHAVLKRAGLDTAGFAGISFRAGGATSLSAAGASDREVQIAGRWASDAYQRYIATPPSRIAALGARA